MNYNERPLTDRPMSNVVAVGRKWPLLDERQFSVVGSETADVPD